MDNHEVRKIKASEHEQYSVFTIIGVLLPIIGIILGIVYLTKDRKLDKKLGEHTLAVSILFLIIWGAGYAILAATRTSSPTYTTPTYSSQGSTSTPVSTWDYLASYAKVQEVMTKTQAESAIGKASNNCTESEVMGQKAEACTYGDVTTDHGLIVVQYNNGVVTSKSKSSY